MKGTLTYNQVQRPALLQVRGMCIRYPFSLGRSTKDVRCCASEKKKEIRVLLIKNLI